MSMNKIIFYWSNLKKKNKFKERAFLIAKDTKTVIIRRLILN